MVDIPGYLMGIYKRTFFWWSSMGVTIGPSVGIEALQLYL